MNTSGPTAHILEARLFGSPEFRRHGEALPPLAAHKTTSLLAYLILHNHCPHSREKLAALFWGDVLDERARHSLRTALANLHEEVGHELFITDRETVQINPEVSIWVDALELQKSADSAAQDEVTKLQYAIDLHRGNLLADF